jgi:hypothetical protein
MENGTISWSMNYIIPELTRDTIVALGQLQEMKRSKKDEYLEEITRIWTTLSHSQKEGLMQEAIRASQLNQAIEALPAIKMARSNHNVVKRNANGN